MSDTLPSFQKIQRKYKEVTNADCFTVRYMLIRSILWCLAHYTKHDNDYFSEDTLLWIKSSSVTRQHKYTPGVETFLEMDLGQCFTKHALVDSKILAWRMAEKSVSNQKFHVNPNFSISICDVMYTIQCHYSETVHIETEYLKLP
jgi:hypothetical protein